MIHKARARATHSYVEITRLVFTGRIFAHNALSDAPHNCLDAFQARIIYFLILAGPTAGGAVAVKVGTVLRIILAGLGIAHTITSRVLNHHVGLE